MTQATSPKGDATSRRLLIVQLMLVGMLLTALTLAAIADRQAPAGTPAAQPTPTAAPGSATAEQLPSPSAEPPAATPTNTPRPTITLTATITHTAGPTPTPTRPPEPITRTGTGDSVFYPQKWIGPAIVRILYDGSGPFAAWTQNDFGQREDMLANSLGSYHGESLIDFMTNQRTLRLEVRTKESWHMEVLPLSAARRASVPGVITGTGDEVVQLDWTSAPDELSADATSAWGNFRVWAYAQPSSLIINVVVPYSDSVTLPPNTTALAVKAVGPWRLEVTTR